MRIGVWLRPALSDCLDQPANIAGRLRCMAPRRVQKVIQHPFLGSSDIHSGDSDCVLDITQRLNDILGCVYGVEFLRVPKVILAATPLALLYSTFSGWTR